MTSIPGQEKREEIMQKLTVVQKIKWVPLKFLFNLFHFLTSSCFPGREENVALEKMMIQMKSLLKCSSKEAQLLSDYRQELDYLIQEKMSHVEELRLIHADINLVCERFGKFERVLSDLWLARFMLFVFSFDRKWLPSRKSQIA